MSRQPSDRLSILPGRPSSGRLMLVWLTFGWILSTSIASPAVWGQPPIEDSEQVSEFKAMMLTSKAFRAAVKSIETSLVSIESFGGVSARQGRIGGIREQGEGNTTGVIISQDGYILTSTFNFIQNPPVVTVTTFDGRRRVAKLLGRDDTRKVCLLKIEGVENLPVPDMAPQQDIKVGQWAISVGVGYGDQSPAVSTGIVSATHRIGGRAIQTDANISPANYGGPLLDIEGRMLGICVPMHPQSQAVAAGVEWYDSGIGFAVPVADFEKLIARLKDGTRIFPAFLGLATDSRPDGEGLLVTEVVKGSAAEKAGIKKDDVVLQINQEPVSDTLKLRQLLNRMEAGQTITLLVEQQDEENEVSILLTPPPKPKGQPELQLEPPRIR